MNKSDLVDALASASGMTKADASRAVDAMFSLVTGLLPVLCVVVIAFRLLASARSRSSTARLVWVATLAQGSRFRSPRATVLRSRPVRV